MRSLILKALALLSLAGVLTLPVSAAAESRRDIPDYGMERGNPDHRSGDLRQEKGRRLHEDRLGRYLAWRDYQMHMQKHYRIMEKYGGGTSSPAYRPAYRQPPWHDYHDNQNRTTNRRGERR